MINIYLCDLIYDTHKTNYSIPLNIAYIAAYTKERYTIDVNISIFKYPSELEKALKKLSPEIIGLSNYSWNENLSHLFIRMAKRLNPETITVMGGPNIRTDRKWITKYLSENKALDYYIPFEGEIPFGNLVDDVINLKLSTPPLGCAGLINGHLHYEPIKQSKQINMPSPYLTGVLDRYLLDPNIIPLLETNRGCPYGCTYCTWGISVLSKVRKRSLDVIYQELDHIVALSPQVNWIVCDANFGMFDRDINIAKKIRQIMDEKGRPINVTLWHAKNTSDRNIKIAKIMRDSDGAIVIQSADPQVLKNCGRKNIKFNQITKQIKYYKENHIEVSTDVLIGLPGETAESHLNTLITVFDLGFGRVLLYNIRMLPGSQYETDRDRNKYGIKTKFRPIFGAFGVYDGQQVFEIEESVRATKDMSELDLEHFKMIHWLVYFAWNTGIFKPVLRYAHSHGVNPAIVLSQLYTCKSSLLMGVFDKMKQESIGEWFETKNAMTRYYNDKKHFNELINNFVKLNPLWIARVYQNTTIISTLLYKIVKIITEETKNENQETLIEMVRITKKLICKDFLEETIKRDRTTGEALSYIKNDPSLSKKTSIEVEIYRAPEDVKFCKYHLQKDYSIQNLTRFIESGGLHMLTNRIRRGRHGSS